MDFNINDYVLVKLTVAGRWLHRKRHDELRREYPSLPKYVPPKADADGYTKWQLWELMQVFGPGMSLVRDPPFEMVIRIPEPA